MIGLLPDHRACNMRKRTCHTSDICANKMGPAHMNSALDDTRMNRWRSPSTRCQSVIIYSVLHGCLCRRRTSIRGSRFCIQTIRNGDDRTKLPKRAFPMAMDMRPIRAANLSRRARRDVHNANCKHPPDVLSAYTEVVRVAFWPFRPHRHRWGADPHPVPTQRAPARQPNAARQPNVLERLNNKRGGGLGYKPKRRAPCTRPQAPRPQPSPSSQLRNDAVHSNPLPLCLSVHRHAPGRDAPTCSADSRLRLPGRRLGKPRRAQSRVQSSTCRTRSPCRCLRGGAALALCSSRW